ncbi:hypothetical protein [Vulcanisaeta distributa]|uniref:Uncharacterized protein n=1 Tax=Vulcanisaeta distributa (strain DSM 14429 / JCM 11212 / NBRC 100878 / IC-017) TaxID=572478 RepID=E1QTI2_VULDI|nr:hypothetical protein [Vulcanisaeta distributa]ADN49697.1 conserved hypothetical protein [Vulcanisaeta distributa DSM 14429]
MVIFRKVLIPGFPRLSVDEYFLELIKRRKMGMRKLGYMRKKAVLTRLVSVEEYGGEGEGKAEERK